MIMPSLPAYAALLGLAIGPPRSPCPTGQARNVDCRHTKQG
jgi:hypothetical protein